MTNRSLTSTTAIAALVALAGCVGSNMPETAVPPTQTGASVVTVPPAGATVVTPIPQQVGTLPPGTVVVVPGSGSSVAPAHLTAAEIDTLISGHTVSGTTSSGAPYTMNFGRSGVVNYREGANFTSAGSWRVSPGGELCSRFNNINSGTESCYLLYRNSNNTYTYERPDGHAIGSFTVVPG